MSQPPAQDVVFNYCEVIALSPVDREDFIVEVNSREGEKLLGLFEILRDHGVVKIVFDTAQQGSVAWQMPLDEFKRLLDSAETRWRDCDAPADPDA